MTFCKQCGVELEDHMQHCPLCGTSVSSDSADTGQSKASMHVDAPDIRKRHLLSQVLLQIASILLLSGIASTLIIDWAMKGQITWSVYPISICLIILCYVVLISLWHTQTAYQLFAGWLLAGAVLLIVNVLLEEEWPLRLALPILCAANTIALALTFILKYLKTKGLNVLVIVMLAIAVLCLAIEGIITLYYNNIIQLRWSVIVSACLLPVVAAIVFMHFRTKDNNELKKIFHT